MEAFQSLDFCSPSIHCCIVAIGKATLARLRWKVWPQDLLPSMQSEYQQGSTTGKTTECNAQDSRWRIADHDHLMHTAQDTASNIGRVGWKEGEGKEFTLEESIIIISSAPLAVFGQSH